MNKIIVFLIKLYQRLVSPLLGSRCRFHPNCSQYAILCLEKHKTGKACWLIIRRLVRCQPFNPGGIDPVP